MKTAVVESNEYRALRETRAQKVKRFMRSGEFRTSNMKACFSSIPRWRMIRELNKKPMTKRSKISGGEPVDEIGNDSDPDDNAFAQVSMPVQLRGISRGQKAFLDETRKIYKGLDDVAELFVGREKNHATIRLEIWRSMAEVALYLGEKNPPYTGHAYRVLRGELDPWAFINSISTQGQKPLCCADTGAEEKIYCYVLNYANEDDACAKELRLLMALGVANTVYTSVGGADNTAIEGLFSICRMLGLRLFFAHKYLYFFDFFWRTPLLCLCA